MINQENYQNICKELDNRCLLVAVSKTKPIQDILEVYALGQRDFGENYVQELLEKESILPNDIRWHFIGHLQRNKVKALVPFVYLIHGVDSLRLLKEINKEGKKIARKVPCLLQVHIAEEETKFGFDETELEEAIGTSQTLGFVEVRGLMGMASFSENKAQISREFEQLRKLYDRYASSQGWNALSMGMSGDYPLALAAGSSIVRIGSLLFGTREKKQS